MKKRNNRWWQSKKFISQVSQDSTVYSVTPAEHQPPVEVSHKSGIDSNLMWVCGCVLCPQICSPAKTTVTGTVSHPPTYYADKETETQRCLMIRTWKWWCRDSNTSLSSPKVHAFHLCTLLPRPGQTGKDCGEGAIWEPNMKRKIGKAHLWFAGSQPA